VDGRRRTGWFAEDFTWAEIRSLRARERMPRLRIASAMHDAQAPVLRLSEAAAIAASADVLLVVELKEARLSAGLGLPLPAIVSAELGALARPPAVVLESFERSPLLELRATGVAWPIVYLLDDHGHAADIHDGGASYAAELADPAALQDFDGVSLPTTLITRGRTALLHTFDLDVWTWTLRPENRFLEPIHRRGSAPGARGDWITAWSRLLEAGVDGVFVDHPDLAVGLMDIALPLVGSA
jgi:glycerophosphoryl diester phosphodiesterase